MKMKRAILSVILCIILIYSTACGNSEKTDTAGQTTTGDTASAAKEVSFPLKESATLTMWCGFNVNASKVMSDFSGSHVFQEMEKITNTKIKFIHPAIGQEVEQFNLMIASNEYPDMVMGGISFYAGGGDKAVADGIFIKLNDLIAKYAPNYSKLLANNPDAARQCSSDNSIMSAILPIMRQDNLCWHGPSIRADWLKETGLDTPVTISDWEEMLTAMKKNHPDSTPLIFNFAGAPVGEGFKNRGEDHWGVFLSAYGMGPSLYNDNGTVKLGAIQPGYKDYLELINRWYKNGLIDADFPARDEEGLNAIITSGKAGAMVGSVDIASNLFGSQKIDYVTAPYPVLKEGDKINYRAFDAVASPIANSVSISTQCKNPEIAVAWLDYAFSEKGSLLYNFGLEGEGYTLQEGKPVFTDTVLNNPDISTETALFLYKMQSFPQLRYGAYANPGTLRKPAVMEQKIAWTEQCTADLAMPPVTLTADEAKAYSNIMSTANVYRNEMVLKFIMGAESLDKFDSYVKQMDKMGINDAIKIYQDALGRYLKR
ncbi:extracellular solute-binding protein [Ruminiclostridium cellobioparum]|jgi:putative aldouronate transport system substrate-binding protein|uniref:extracellular solute-binding protein n=1 Tax=Ruminiclostridium cellobioparum TaxID=29355 RepID=UPI0028ACBC51|nr:extracellular solute-binding protein [Ruminiclostridium cellobioparum]